MFSFKFHYLTHTKYGILPASQPRVLLKSPWTPYCLSWFWPARVFGAVLPFRHTILPPPLPAHHLIGRLLPSCRSRVVWCFYHATLDLIASVCFVNPAPPAPHLIARYYQIGAQGLWKFSPPWHVGKLGAKTDRVGSSGGSGNNRLDARYDTV